MKIALCFSGQIRTGAVTAPNILRYIGDLLPNCDFFVHTWDVECLGTGYSNRLGTDSLSESVHTTIPVKDKDKFADFYRAYNPVAMVVEQYDLTKTLSTWGGRRFNPGAGKRYISMWESVYEANLLKMTYARKNQINYDYTIRIRPDTVFDEHKSLADDIAQITNDNMFVFGDHYNIYPGHGMSRLEDIYWIGPSRVMDQITCVHELMANTTTDSMIDDPKDPNYTDWQFHSARWITQSLGIQFKALADSTMRIYYQIDIDRNIDPMNPGFGSPPGRLDY